MPVFLRVTRQAGLQAWAAVLTVFLTLSGCGGTSKHALDASIQDLVTSGLVLSVNGSTQSVPAGATTQMLAPALSSGAPYVVTIAAQPAAEACTVTNGSGRIGNSDATVVAVTCVPKSYPVIGTIAGLTADGLVVLDNGADATAIGANATQFMMPTQIPYGSSYSLTIQSQPAGLTCSISGATGTMALGGTTVAVTCSSNTYSVGGTVSGLMAGGLVLLDNATDAVSVPANAASFTMDTPIAFGSAYAVTVQSQPTGLVCSVNNAAGRMGAGNITNIAIDCVKNTTVLYFFQGGNDGTAPLGPLLQGTNGDLYGMSSSGGTHGDGTVFEVTVTGVETVLHSFAGADGQSPDGGLIEDANGDFFGTSVYGGSVGFGTAFELDANQTETVLHSFTKAGDGGYPICSLVEDGNGNLYGTTWGGGLTHGIVFEVRSGGSETVLHSFADNSSDGGYPTAGLVPGSDGNFYGTTASGGSANAGTVFKITPGGVETLLYTFSGGTDGGDPQAALIQGRDGNFYGTTSAGGADGAGTVFQVTPNGTETVVYSFAGGSGDGSFPVGGLLQARDGNFYGTTKQGGSSGDGTVFQVTSDGVEKVIYSFAGGPSDGAAPAASLIQGSDGRLYGTTSAGGPNGFGAVFAVVLQ